MSTDKVLTKDEILTSLQIDIDNWPIKSNILDAMDKFAKQQSVNYLKWIEMDSVINHYVLYDKFLQDTKSKCRSYLVRYRSPAKRQDTNLIRHRYRQGNFKIKWEIIKIYSWKNLVRL